MNSEKKYTTSHRRDNYLSFTTYKGDPSAVVQAVADRIRNDNVTRYYEHMLTRVCRVEILETGELQVETIKNLYAGD